MKKVLITVTTLKGGGAERVVSVWASQLAEMGYDISLLIYGRTDNEYAVDERVKIHTIANTYPEYKKMGHFSRLFKMRKVVKGIEPDVIINFLPRMQIWMMMATFGLKMKRVETVRISPWVVCKSNKFEKFLWHRCFDFSDKIIIQTAEQGEYFNQKLQEKCVVIPNPINSACVENYKTTYSENVKEFIAAGRLTPQKNYLLMFEAFAKAYQSNPNIKLSVYGTGDDKYIEFLQEKIDEFGMNGIITLKGRTTDMVSALLESDAFLMSSDYEGMPNALAEAMACGLVCLSTDCKTGPKDLIDHGINGYLSKVGDVDAFAEHILNISNLSTHEAEMIGVAARRKVLELCNERNSLRKLIELIEND